jgi:hypothetical protein
MDVRGDDETEDGLHQWDYLTRTFDGDLTDPRSPRHAAAAAAPPPPPYPVSEPFYFRTNVILDVSNPETLRLPRQMVSFIPKGHFYPGIYPSWPPEPLHSVSTPVVQFPHHRQDAMAIGRLNAMDMRWPMGWANEYPARDVSRAAQASMITNNNVLDDRKPAPLGNTKVGAVSDRLTQAIEQTAASRVALEVAVAASQPPSPRPLSLPFINNYSTLTMGTQPRVPTILEAAASAEEWPQFASAAAPSTAVPAAPQLPTPPPPPPAAPVCKPFTPYNFFFRDERDNIILGLRDSDDDLPPPVCDFSDAKMARLLQYRWYVGISQPVS